MVTHWHVIECPTVALERSSARPSCPICPDDRPLAVGHDGQESKMPARSQMPLNTTSDSSIMACASRWRRHRTCRVSQHVLTRQKALDVLYDECTTLSPTPWLFECCQDTTTLRCTTISSRCLTLRILTVAFAFKVAEFGVVRCHCAHRLSSCTGLLIQLLQSWDGLQ